MKIQNFLSNFDKKRLNFVSKIIVLFLFLVLVINILGITYSKYETSSPAKGEANVAYFVVEPGKINGSISLDGLVPSNNKYEYTINVSNFKGDGGERVRTNVNLSYNISFETTTNLPLKIDIYKGETKVASAENAIEYRDQDCVYYKRYILPTKYTFTYENDQTDQYKLKIEFPLEYKNNPQAYSGTVELLSVIIDAEQKTNRTVITNEDYQMPTDYSDTCTIEEETT